eukprot:jgi/Chlat1/4568/Chrsp29S00341
MAAGDHESAALDAGRAAGRINETSETMDLPEASKAAQEKQEKMIKEFAARRKRREVVVPVNDAQVRAKLRELGEPVTLFGEGMMDRRDRLRRIMADIELEVAQRGELDGESTSDEGEDFDEDDEEEGRQKHLFYTEGTQDLRQARLRFAEYSIPLAAARLARAKRVYADPDEDPDQETEAVLATARRLANGASEIGDDRPLAACTLSPDGSTLVTSGWSGLTKLWSVPHLKKLATLRTHQERITGVAFHPALNSGLPADGPAIATASADATAKLWTMDGTLVRTIKGHLDRLGRIVFHPMGQHVATTSYDKTWRLWDEGSSRAVYSVAFQRDGALAVSCGLDALGRVWDLRTGRSIVLLQGHVKPVLAVDFSPNGYHVATGSEDHAVKIWDLRKRQCMYTIPAHAHLVKFEPRDGHFLVSSSYDNTAKVWSSLDFKLVKILVGHENKVMDVDVAAEGEHLVTVSYDRTLKLWTPEADQEKPAGDEPMEEG